MDLDLAPASKKRKVEGGADSKALFSEMRKILFQLSQTNNIDNNNNQNNEKLLNEIGLKLIELKRYSKHSQEQTEEVKKNNEKTSDRLAETLIALNNLEYERSVLQADIEMTKSTRQSITFVEDLFTMDEFQQRNQQNQNQAAINTIDDHQKQLNLYAFELQERKRLVGQLENLKVERKAIEEENNRKKKFLDGLLTRIKQIQKSTEPIEKFFFGESERKLNVVVGSEKANLLPNSLFTLFYQFSLYSQSFDDSLELSIQGDPEEINQFEKKREKSISKSELFAIHPLSILLEFSLKDGKRIGVRFGWMSNLEVVGVSVNGLAWSSLLNLFPTDNGSFSPNPKSIQKNGNNESSTTTNNNTNNNNQNKINEGRIKIEGIWRPYRWAQQIGGLDFIPTPESRSLNISRSLSVIIPKLKQRLNSFASLQSQLSSLAKGIVETKMPELEARLPLRPSSVLKSFNSISSQEFEKRTAQTMNEEGELGGIKNLEGEDGSLFYRGLVSKGDVSIDVLIYISSEYPLRAPSFRLSLSRSASVSSELPAFVKNSTHQTALQNVSQLTQFTTSTFDPNLKTIETELNSNYSTLSTSNSDDFLLSNQFFRLLGLFDVFVNALNNPNQTTLRGRDRNSLSHWVQQ